MGRREDIWMQLGAIDPTAENLFDNYSDPFGYDQMNSVLDKLFQSQQNALTRNSANTIQRGQKDVASRLASQGITGGSVYNNQINKVTDNVGSSFADALEKLGVDRMGQNIGLMNTANQNKFRSTSAQQNVLLQNIMNALRKNQDQQQAVNSWEQMDLTRDSQPGTWDDIMAGIDAASKVASIFTSDHRLKENISKIGVSPKGTNIYEFNYIGNPKRFRGVMADEVPEATIEKDGIKFVDYNKTDVEFQAV